MEDLFNFWVLKNRVCLTFFRGSLSRPGDFGDKGQILLNFLEEKLNKIEAKRRAEEEQRGS
jgi:hypothetical protein